MQAAGLSGAGRYGEALPLLEQVLALNPGNYKALDHQSYALVQLGRYADALPALERLEREGPLWAATWYNLGVCLKETGKPEAALEKFRRCSELDPSNARPCCRSSRCWKRGERRKRRYPIASA